MRKSRLPLVSRLLVLASVFASLSLSTVDAEAVVIRSVSGASGFENTVEPFTVYGGLSGTITGTAGASLYDSCASATGLVPCNSSRVHPDALLTINFKSDSGTGTTGLWIIKNSTATRINSQSNNTGVTAGSETFVTVKWGDICDNFGDGDSTGGNITSGCAYAGTGPATATFKVGFWTSATDSTIGSDTKEFKIVMGGDTTGAVQTVDDCNVAAPANPYGVCSWQMNPGDEKALLKSPVPHQGRTGPIMQFNRIRVFYVPVTNINDPTADFQSISASTRTYSDLRIETSDAGALSVVPGRVEGLKNDTTYAFKIAMIDLAGNVGFYTANGDSVAGTGDYYCESPERANAAVPNCHIATPGEVVGVLSKQVTCFIATAAFGSQMAPQVETFRQFRNEFLLKHDLGVRFVRFYYRHSPKYAAIIAESPILRAAARGVLWPFLGFAWLSLKIGTSEAAALVSMIALALFFVVRRLSRSRRSSRA